MKNLNEAKAGIMALNVISDDNFLEINGVRIERKEWEGKNVISSYDVSRIHNKPVKRVNENFKRNINKFVEEEDFFRVPADSDMRSVIATGSFKHSNNKFENLFTERGYLKLVKTFTDDFSWKVQDILIDEYFNMKKLRNAFENGEIEIIPKSQPEPYSPSEYELTNQKIEMMKTENEKEKLKLELGNSFERIADKIINEKMKNTLLIYSANSLAGKEILQLPAAEKLSFEAGKIAEKLNEKYGTNIAGNRIGRIAKEYKLKTSEYGY